MAKRKPETQAQETAPAVAETQTTALAKPLAGFKLKRRVILPTLSLQTAVPVILRIEDAIRVSTYTDPDPKKAKEKPADVCTVTDMQTGAQMLLLVPAVMLSALERDYLKASYVGLIFAVQKLPKRPGKRYFDIDLAEVEIDLAKVEIE